METPAISVASTGTMFAPKRAVMIDDPTGATTVLADPESQALAHPSQTARTKRGQRTRTKSLPVGPPVPEKTPVTCHICRITYLPAAIPPASTSSEAWVCDICQRALG